MGVPDPAGRAAVSDVEVLLVRVVPGAADDPRMVEVLGARERESIQSLGFSADRDRAVTARAAARLELGRRLGTQPTLVPLSTPELRGGRPFVRGARIGISRSHSGEWVALALAVGCPVGVDIELVPNPTPVKAIALIGAESLWDFVAREAAGKATGCGLAGPWPPDVLVRPFETPAGYLGAVAAPGDDWSLRVAPRERGDPRAASATAVGSGTSPVPGRERPRTRPEPAGGSGLTQRSPPRGCSGGGSPGTPPED